MSDTETSPSYSYASDDSDTVLSETDNARNEIVSPFNFRKTSSKGTWVALSPQPVLLPGIFKYAHNYKVCVDERDRFKSVRVYVCGQHVNCQYKIRVKFSHDGSNLFEKMEGAIHSVVSVNKAKNLGMDMRLKPMVNDLFFHTKIHFFI